MRKERVGVLLIISAAIIFLMAHTARTQNRPPAAKAAVAEKKSPAPSKARQRLSPAASQWVEATLRKMSVDEKIGQILFATYHGSFTSTIPRFRKLLESTGTIDL